MYGGVVAPGSESRREFHVTFVIRTDLPTILRSRLSRIRDHPEDDTTIKLTPEAVDCGADVRIAVEGPATRQGLRAEGPDQRDTHRSGEGPTPATAASESRVNLARKLLE